MKKKKVIKLDIDGMPLKEFIQYMIGKMGDIPCTARVELLPDEWNDTELCITYYKNECKK